MLHEAFGEHSLSWTAIYEWHSLFKADWVSVEDYERSGWPSTCKTTESVEKFENSSMKTVTEQSWACRFHWDQLWSSPGDLNRKFEHAPHCHEVYSPTMTTRPPTHP
jgi:hypothetical protein